jgi:hypothetical protein
MKGSGETNEDALMDMFMRMSNGTSGNGESDGNDMSEDYDDDEDNYGDDLLEDDQSRSA